MKKSIFASGLACLALMIACGGGTPAAQEPATGSKSPSVANAKPTETVRQAFLAIAAIQAASARRSATRARIAGPARSVVTRRSVIATVRPMRIVAQGMRAKAARPTSSAT
jgi:hypothetical protein